MKTRLPYFLAAFLCISTALPLTAQKKEQGIDPLPGTAHATTRSSDSAASWFRDAKYAMFIHWSLFSQHANRWKGQTYYGIGEWLMYLAKARVDEYSATAAEFNPQQFNAKEWVQLAKDAGMKYIVITAKHHEGFAMFKSANPYNIVDATPFKRDPMKELAAACKEAGIRLGFYYSQFQDWHEINSWSPDLKKISFEEYFNNKCKPQVKELLTQYGPLELIWFDTPGEMTAAQSQEIVSLVKQYQPQALINSRIGNGAGDYTTFGDQEIPPGNIPGLWEAVNTSNDSWGYAWYDENWKGPAEIAADLVQVVARGGNFMLNIGPKGDGSIPTRNADFLRASGRWIHQHAKPLYAAKPSPWSTGLPWGDITQTGNHLNLFVFNWKAGASIWLPGLKTKVRAARLSSGNEKLVFTQDASNWLRIQLPSRPKKELIEVIDLELAGAPEVDTTLGLDPVQTTIFGADFAVTRGCTKGKSSWMEKFGDWKHKTLLSAWESGSSEASWVINVQKPGLYFVDADYHAWLEADGSTYDLITQTGDSLRIYATATAGSSRRNDNEPDPVGWIRSRYRTVRMGVIEFTRPGSQTIRFVAAAAPKAGGIDLHALHFTPLE